MTADLCRGNRPQVIGCLLFLEQSTLQCARHFCSRRTFCRVITPGALACPALRRVGAQYLASGTEAEWAPGYTHTA